MSDNPTLTARISVDGIELESAEHVGRHTRDGWESDHWRVRMTHGDRFMVTTYHMGTGHNGAEPDLETVLDSLCSDAAGADQSFEDWASDYGYDTDSRKAEATYLAVVEQTKTLRAFLGEDRFDAYVYETERL